MNAIVERFYKAVEILLALILGLIVITVTIQVFSRYVLNNPTSWSEETTRYLFVWLSLLGASLALHKGKHLGVDNLANCLKGKVQDCYFIVVSIVIIAYLLVLEVATVQLTLLVLPQNSPAIGISMALPYGGLVVGIFLMLLEEIGTLFRRILSIRTVSSNQG